jgi:hypothetical protein
LENDSYMMRRIRKALGSGPFFRKQRIWLICSRLYFLKGTALVFKLRPFNPRAHVTYDTLQKVAQRVLVLKVILKVVFCLLVSVWIVVSRRFKRLWLLWLIFVWVKRISILSQF